MRSIKTCGLIFFFISQLAFAQNGEQDIFKQQALDAQSSRFTAMIQADEDMLKELLSDDLSYSHTTGWTETKSEFLTTVKSEKINYLSITPKDLNVRIYENTAVLTGLADVKLIHSKGEAEFVIRFLEVQHKVNDSWKLVAWQSVKNLVD